ncbi:NAD(P)H-binding protein [Dactylosporangium sp. NPDC005572]|uniref:NAD(P)H-binding protein n=1 Tax=Dactylosporangium sp. NPDC005572 TaxID=3156889 RepID=UPI0033B6A7F1
MTERDIAAVEASRRVGGVRQADEAGPPSAITIVSGGVSVNVNNHGGCWTSFLTTELRALAQRLRASGLSARRASCSGGDVLFDLGAPATWGSALTGVSAAYLIEPDLRASILSPERLPDLVDTAVHAGVRRLVLLSALTADSDSHPLHPGDQAVRRSGVSWTILRPTWFAQNFSEDFWRPGILAGTLAAPTGDGRTPFVDAEDIADVAASALTDDRHGGAVYDLTGPRALSFGEATGLIGRATGCVVRHADVDPEVFVERQVAYGVPAEVARLLTELLTDVRSGSAEAVTDGVQRALGRPPASFEQFVARSATAGAWN